MIIYKPYTMDAASSSLLQRMYQSNNCFKGYNMHLVCLFENPYEPINRVSPTMTIDELSSNHHPILLDLRMLNLQSSHLAPHSNGQYRSPSWQTLLELVDLIRWSPAEV
jgi:hypothetical protein